MQNINPEPLAPRETWALARYLAGSPRLEGEYLQGELAIAAGAALLERGDGERLDVMDAWLAKQAPATARSIKQAILAVDPTTPPPESASGLEELGPPCPPLPPEVGLDPALGVGAGAWLDAYLAYASGVSPMSPTLFHTGCGLFVASTVVARRLVVRRPIGPIHPNLWVCLLGETTMWRKSTALLVALRLLRLVCPHLLAAQDSTVEALLSDLAGFPPTNLSQLDEDARARWTRKRDYAAQRGVVLDEISGFHAALGKDYNNGLLETFIALHDCADEYERSTRGQGDLLIRGAYLALLGASTPSAMEPHLGPKSLWRKGWWARFALLSPAGEPLPWQIPGDEPPVEPLAEGLRRLTAALPTARWPDPPAAREVAVTAEASALWQRYAQTLETTLLRPPLDDRFHGTYGRLGTQALKVATLLAALDWSQGDTSGSPTVELSHLTRAIGLTEEWRASAHRAAGKAKDGERAALYTRIRAEAARRAAQGGASESEICRAVRDLVPDVVQRAVQQLVVLGDLECVKVTHDGPGRPTERYRLVSSN